MRKKPSHRGGNVLPMKAYRGRRGGKPRRYWDRAKLMVLLAALGIGVVYNFDGLTADLRTTIGWGQPEIAGESRLSLSGRVTHVRDADTVEVSGVPVRIANLDCAERGTAAGDQATERMKQLVILGSFSCRLEGRQSYDREVGTCQLADGRDVGEVLINERQCGRWY